MIEKTSSSICSAAVDAYTAFESNSRIRGTVIEKDGKDIKLDIGDNEVLEARLKEDVEANVGDIVLLDRKNIARSKMTSKNEHVQVEESDRDYYAKMLGKLDIEASEENIKAAKRLQLNEVPLTRENIQTYIIAKTSLQQISSSLDYGSAVKLSNMDIDIENDSLQKIALSLGEINEEKEGFSILRLIGKKELSTEQAEEIAKKLYGSRMGKDITDIIKSLHRVNASITKKNVEKINDVFYKLDKLSDIEDRTFIDTLKNKLDMSIDNLYNIKRFVKKGQIQQTDAVQTRDVQMYSRVQKPSARVTQKDLALLEEDIKSHLDSIEIEPSSENVKLSKEFIKRDMDVTRQNIETISEMKSALESVTKGLDREKASKLVSLGVDIGREDIRELARRIEELEGNFGETEAELTNGKTERGTQENEQNKTMSQPDKPVFYESDQTKVASDGNENTKADTKFEENSEKINDGKIMQGYENGLDETVKTAKDEAAIEGRIEKMDLDIDEVLIKINNLKNISEKDLLNLLRKNVDFKISKIEQVIFGSTAGQAEYKITDLNYASILKTENQTGEAAAQAASGSITRIAEAFKNIGRLEFNTIAFNMRNNISMTIANLEKSGKLLSSTRGSASSNLRDYSSEIALPRLINAETEAKIKNHVYNDMGMRSDAFDAAKALVQNGLNLNRANVQRALDVYSSYSKVRENLSTGMVVECFSRDINVENVDVRALSKYAAEYDTNQSRAKMQVNSGAADIAQSVAEMGSEGESGIVFLMRNKRAISIGELKKAHKLSKNIEQSAHRISDIIEFISENADEDSAKQTEQIKNSIKEITKSLKDKAGDPEKSYEEMEDALRTVQAGVKLPKDEDNTALKRKFDELSDTLEQSQKMARESRILQFPVYMNGQMSNLNMYFRDRKNGSSKMNAQDMSLAMSIDTKNMGNINISVEVDKKDVNVKIGLEDPADRRYIESQRDLFEQLMAQSGYLAGKVTFAEEGELSILNPDGQVQESDPGKGILDIRI